MFARTGKASVWRVACLLGALLGTVACSAEDADGPTASGGDGGSDGDGATGGSGVGGGAGAGAGGSGGSGGSATGTGLASQELTRLTRAEYRETLLLAFGLEPDLSALPEDGRVAGFTSNLLITPDPVHPYLLSAEALAEQLVPDALPACDASDAVACLEDNYRGPLSKLYRRDITDQEMTAFSTLLGDLQTADVTPLQASRAVLSAALIGPDFLYRSSPAHSDAAPSPRKLAERISFTLWDAPPDVELKLAAQDAGAGFGALESQAARLARDDRAIPVLARFLGQWLEVDTDLRLEDPAFATSPAFLEHLALVRNAVQDEVPITELIGGGFGFVHADNVDTYGIPDPGAEPGEVVRVDWPADSGRRGILAQELMVGSTRHPDTSRREIFRGLLVRRALLCDTIPAPSPDLIAMAGEVSDRLADSRCQRCHLLLDPVGRAFAAFDGDATTVPEAQLVSHPEVAGTYETVGELLVAVAASRAFAECFAEHWLEFFLESPRANIDQGWTTSIADAVQAGASLADVVGQTVRELGATLETQEPWCGGP